MVDRMTTLKSVTAAFVILLACAQAASAQLPQQSGTVDLLTQANVQIDGIEPDDELGDEIAAAGDVNGDGLGDLIAQADGEDLAGQGTAWVIFGRPEPGRIDLAALGSGGFRINGVSSSDPTGFGLAGVGDVNGDGRGDLAVASPFTGAGSIYLVHGRTGGGTVDLAAPGAAAVRIVGAATDDRLWDAAAAGDFDGDGTGDLVVGSSDASNNGRSASGSAYVLSGAALAGPVIDLASPGAALLRRIDGAAADDFTGEALAAAGDFNGDDYDDIIVGAPCAENCIGAAYVVYGSDATGPLDLAALGTAGLRIDGVGRRDFAGSAVAAAPDMNADGLDDVLVGASGADHGGENAGSAYVVFGRAAPGTVDLGALGGDGLRFDGIDDEWAGGDVASAGDVNDDGVQDLLIGGDEGDANGRSNSGSAWVVYGPVTEPVTSLNALGNRGIRIDGALEDGFAGDGVAGLGDFNGDGRDDVAVSAPFVNLGADQDPGMVSIVYGFGTRSLAYSGSIAGRVGEPVTRLAPAVSRTGPAGFAVSPALPAGLALDPSTGAITGTPQEAAAGLHTVTMTDLTGASTATVAIDVAAPPPAAVVAPAAAAAPTTTALTGLTVRRRCATSARRVSVRFRLSAAATVRLEIARRTGGPRAGIRCLRGARFHTAAAFRAITLERQLAAGPQRLRLSRLLAGRRLPAGPYVLRASVPGGQVETVRFRIRA